MKFQWSVGNMGWNTLQRFGKLIHPQIAHSQANGQNDNLELCMTHKVSIRSCERIGPQPGVKTRERSGSSCPVERFGQKMIIGCPGGPIRSGLSRQRSTLKMSSVESEAFGSDESDSPSLPEEEG